MATLNERKVAVVGCGFVGSASAFALMEERRLRVKRLISATVFLLQSLCRYMPVIIKMQGMLLL